MRSQKIHFFGTKWAIERWKICSVFLCDDWVSGGGYNSVPQATINQALSLIKFPTWYSLPWFEMCSCNKIDNKRHNSNITHHRWAEKKPHYVHLAPEHVFTIKHLMGTG